MIGTVCETQRNGFAAMVLYLAAYLFDDLGRLRPASSVLVAHGQ